MVRPIKPRQISRYPGVFYFKPQGIPLHLLDEVIIMPDEFEALNLYSVENLDQLSAAFKMGISQPTFARILQRVNKKVAHAIVHGKAIKIEKNY
jgi:predicted DNA-binding protein (UPF0251 family)